MGSHICSCNDSYLNSFYKQNRLECKGRTSWKEEVKNQEWEEDKRRLQEMNMIKISLYENTKMKSIIVYI